MPNIHRFSQNVYVQRSFICNLAVPGAVGAAGTAWDTLQFRRAALVIDVTTGGSTGTTIKLQDSPDNITFTDVTSGAFAAVGASANVTAIMDIDLSKRARYLRAYYTNTGTPVGYASAVFHLFEPANTDYISQTTTVISV